MARYHGNVGYATEVETYPGVWEAQITEHDYYGDVVKNKVNVQQSSTMNPVISISVNLSIVADPFAYENFTNMRYATYMGKKWTITAIEIEQPRMILTLGGLYNG